MQEDNEINGKKIQHALKTYNNTQLEYIPHNSTTNRQINHSKVVEKQNVLLSLLADITFLLLTRKRGGTIRIEFNKNNKNTYLAYPHHIQQYKKNISHLIQENKLN